MSGSTSPSFTSNLASRSTFLSHIQKALEQPTSPYPFAVLFLDLNLFRLVNNALGYEAGDQLLVEAESRLAEILRPEDTLTHLSADEFAVLLVNGANAVRVADRMQETLAQPFTLKGREVFITSSIGIVRVQSEEIYHPAEILRNASIAMMHAKAQGRGRHSVFDQGMWIEKMQRFELEHELRRAIDRNEFQIFYQPVVALGSGDFKGFEALVRWLHPKRGFIYPNQFIPVAEETGLITVINDWVLREACRQAQFWQERTGAKLPLGVSVNMASRQFAHSSLPQYVEQALSQSRLDAASLQIEISENVLMENPELSVQQLAQLKGLGVQLHLDDFGIGQSSLGWLHRFPIDVLKINKSFLSRMTGNQKTAEIVKSIVALGHNLNMAVVAKGVETDDQLESIKAANFDYIQGYLLSEPLGKESAAEWLEDFIQVLEAQNV